MRLALVWTADSDVPAIVADSADLDVYSVDERTPGDRVYHMGPGVTRVTEAEFDRLVVGEIFSLGDKPMVEQAIRAILERGPNEKPDLSIVKPE